MDVPEQGEEAVDVPEQVVEVAETTLPPRAGLADELAGVEGIVDVAEQVEEVVDVPEQVEEVAETTLPPGAGLADDVSQPGKIAFWQRE